MPEENSFCNSDSGVAVTDSMVQNFVKEIITFITESVYIVWLLLELE
jgi:hypothetical protein